MALDENDNDINRNIEEMSDCDAGRAADSPTPILNTFVSRREIVVLRSASAMPCVARSPGRGVGSGAAKRTTARERAHHGVEGVSLLIGSIRTILQSRRFSSA